MECPKCKTNVSDDSHFCSKCGTPMKPTDIDISQTKTIKRPTYHFSKGQLIVKKYKILEKIGEGGMGVVFKAEDTKLDRLVALKFLPPELTQDPDSRKRFIQEAKAAAALDHPNICTVYEVNDTDDLTYFSMAYIRGQSLKDKLKDGPLGIDEAKDIALQVAEGLKEAHHKGIVHRDIKPANIMLTEKDQVKITDFGLAKFSGGADLTKASTIMGTLAYMSPEQASGEEVDSRSDIWSLGVMFYEMLTSKRPFEQNQEHALIHAIIYEKPAPIVSIRPDITIHIANAIEKSLSKEIDKRYQKVDELIHDLSQSPPMDLPKAKKSIVVLPFENMSPDPEQEYFTDGLTEEIITDLSKIQSLRVISRNSAMMFKGTRKPTREIGRELNVQYVLEGSVRKAGNNLRITAQLIDATNDDHIWADKFSGTLEDVFDIQEKVSLAIVEALRMSLSPDEKKKLSERPIDNVLAYEWYIKAMQETWRFTEEGVEKAIQYLKKGLEIIGDNAVLYAGMAMAYFQYVNMGAKHEEYIDKTEEYVKKALSLDPDCYKAHLVLSGIQSVFRGNQKESMVHAKKVLSLNPNDPEAVRNMAYLLIFNIGKIETANPLLKRLVEIDPLNPMTTFIEAAFYFFDGKYEASLDPLHRMYQNDPHNPAAQWLYAWALAYTKRHDELYAVMEKFSEASSTNALIQSGLMMKYTFSNDKAKALKALTLDLKKTGKRDPVFAHHIADMLSLLEEKAEALHWLEIAVNQGFLNYPLLSERDPFLENIREEPEFKKLMQRVKHEWENFDI